jgi:hypothetical protein
LVFFRAGIIITNITGMTGSSEIRFGLPVAVNYTSLAMPQALYVGAFAGLTHPNLFDLSMVIGGDGSAIPGESVQYCKLNFRNSLNTTGKSTITASDLASSTFPITIRYSGVYYAF